MRNEENAIEVNAIKKSFKIYKDRSNQLKDAVVFRNFNKYSRRSVIKSISFDIPKGEAVALIGSNGCGKSTTLKMLTRILTPDEGSIEINGRIASLIELGAGFHPDLSGRENIYINASIFGLKKKEVDARVKKIIKFSELEEYIDSPVRTYSSGMYARLAFAVAISVDADVLLVDEILSVGDAAFQKKCMNKIKELKNQGVTIVLVSHSSDQIKMVCDRAIWIEDGYVKEDGDARVVCNNYELSIEKKRIEREDKEHKENVNNTINETFEENKRIELKKIFSSCTDASSRIGNHKIEYVSFDIKDKNGNRVVLEDTDSYIEIEIEYRKKSEELLIGNIIIDIFRSDGVLAYATALKNVRDDYYVFNKYGKVKLVIPKMSLLHGEYYISTRLIDENDYSYDCLEHICEFKMNSPEYGENGITRINSIWEEMS